MHTGMKFVQIILIGLLFANVANSFVSRSVGFTKRIASASVSVSSVSATAPTVKKTMDEWKEELTP